jgi:hypothetical protein
MNPAGQDLRSPRRCRRKERPQPKVSHFAADDPLEQRDVAAGDRSNARLKPSRGAIVMGDRGAGPSWCFLRIIAHSTGVSVSATTPESTMDDAIVIENWR